MQKKYQRFSGFTLMELLIVMAILAMLFALLLPRIFEQRRNQVIRRADIEVQQLYADLELFASTSRNGYPTTEEGLYALSYIPDSVGVSGLSQTAVIPGAEGMTGYDPTGGSMIGTGGGFGTTPSQPIGNQPVGQSNLMQGTTPSTGSTIVGGTDPSQMMNPMATPALGQQGSLMGGGTMGGAAGYSAWNKPIHNPQLYQQRRQRSDGIDENSLTDPWGLPYRYDNTLNQYGVNQYTWKATPAIWSAGPDKIDGNDDDVRGWKIEDIPTLQARVMQQFQQQAGSMAGMGSALGTGTINPLMGITPSGMIPPAGNGVPNMMPPTGSGMPPGMMTPPAANGAPNMMPSTGSGMPPGMMPPPAGSGVPNMMPPTGGTAPGMVTPYTTQ